MVGDAAGAANLTGVAGLLPRPAGRPTRRRSRPGWTASPRTARTPRRPRTAIRTALQQGLLAEADVNRAAGHVLAIRFRLGEFDPAGGNPYAAITADVIDSPEHRALARRAAARASGAADATTGQALPLAAGQPHEVAVVGPLADTLYTDWYSGTMPYQVTPAAGGTRAARCRGHRADQRGRGPDRAAGGRDRPLRHRVAGHAAVARSPRPAPRRAPASTSSTGARTPSPCARPPTAATSRQRRGAGQQRRATQRMVRPAAVQPRPAGRRHRRDRVRRQGRHRVVVRPEPVREWSAVTGG